MPVFPLEKDKISFPPAQFADNDGLLAEGGDVTAQWILEAHKNGFFLWNHPMRYPQWWTPDPRTVLFPGNLDVPAEIQKEISQAGFRVAFNNNLEQLMKFIQKIENSQAMNPRWLTGKLLFAYLDLKKNGLAYSVEIYQNDVLAGGAFGTKVNNICFNEYVSGTVKYAAEFALIALAEKMKDENVVLIDLQKPTNETTDLGFDEISRNEYLHLIKENL
jgi:leucyl/phenylalanyl-tRNA--protein transferase